MNQTNSISKRSPQGSELSWLNAPLPELSKIPAELDKLQKFVQAHKSRSDRSKWNAFLGIERAHKLLARVGRGEFARFIKERCRLSVSYGYQAVRCVGVWGECPPEVREHLSVTALLYLSNSTCKAAICEAKRLAGTGKWLSIADVQALVAKHRDDKGASANIAVKRVNVPGVCTVVLHRTKGSDSAALSRLLLAIENLVKHFESTKKEDAA